MHPEVEAIIDLALKEDIGSGDITTSAIYSGTEMAKAKLVAKEYGCIAGIELAQHILSKVSKTASFKPLAKDGLMVTAGNELALIEGPANDLLVAERVMLNFMQRMSGIATLTNRMVKEIRHTQAQLLDTRKTMPGQRYIDKWAVRLGGGTNHRMRLDDLFLIKENHITVAGGIKEAILACDAYRTKNDLDVKIEIEVPNLEALSQVLDLQAKQALVDIVMLDNMSTSEMKEAVKRVKGAFKLEASGNVRLETIAAIAECGVDYISTGAVTHSAKALDISMLFEAI